MKMPDPSKPVPLEAIEAAAKAMRRDAYRYTWGKTFEYERRVDAEAAILAADEARGMRVERKTVVGEPLEVQRLVSDWQAVEQGVTPDTSY